jgi:hypothetical protein
MATTGHWQTILDKWPELVATGVLIPILQWAATQLWQMRRRSRVIALRKEMNDVEDFILKHKDSNEPRVAEAVRLAQNDRLTLLDKLERASRPLASRPPVRVLASIFLLYRPTYAISWLCRVVFFSSLAAFFWLAYSVFKEPVFDLGRSFKTTAGFLGLVFLLPLIWNWLTRAADKVTGPHVLRPTWQRLSLVYWPVSLAAAVTQFFFWFYVVLIAVDGYDAIVREHDLHMFFVFFLTIFLWVLAHHLDRRSIIQPNH